MTAKRIPELGDQVKDIVTGFSGIVVAKTQWLNGCVRMSVQPRTCKEGKPPDFQQFDMEQLKVVKRAAVAAPSAPMVAAARTGGERTNVAKRHRSPSRT
jgi:hypothetical protein